MRHEFPWRYRVVFRAWAAVRARRPAPPADPSSRRGRCCWTDRPADGRRQTDRRPRPSIWPTPAIKSSCSTSFARASGQNKHQFTYSSYSNFLLHTNMNRIKFLTIFKVSIVTNHANKRHAASEALLDTSLQPKPSTQDGENSSHQ
jgi:hypothetical protein